MVQIMPVHIKQHTIVMVEGEAREHKQAAGALRDLTWHSMPPCCHPLAVCPTAAPRVRDEGHLGVGWTLARQQHLKLPSCERQRTCRCSMQARTRLQPAPAAVRKRGRSTTAATLGMKAGHRTRTPLGTHIISGHLQCRQARLLQALPRRACTHLEVGGDEPEVDELEGHPEQPVALHHLRQVGLELWGNVSCVALQSHDGCSGTWEGAARWVGVWCVWGGGAAGHRHM